MKISTKPQILFPRKKLVIALASMAVTASMSAQAQDPAPGAVPQIEEIVVSGALRTAARAIAAERVNQPFSAEIISLDQIERAGDSDVASALRRVTGLSLIDGKFIYVRGLGERYSSATLNGVEVPSPELSRNVIPLDLFPTSILESVKISKAYSADQPAAFGGGNVDIRTSGVPANFLFSLGLGSGWNFENSGDSLGTVGDGGLLPRTLHQGINDFQGNIQPANITRILSGGASPTPAQLQQGLEVNRQLLLALNRDIEIDEQESINPDQDVSMALGNTWDINSDISFGAVFNGDYSNVVSNRNQAEQNFSNPEEDFRDIQRTFETEDTTLALNLRLDYMDRHNIATNSYLLRNYEDQSSIILANNPDFQLASGLQRETRVTRLEQRELRINQITGQHILEDGDFGYMVLPEFFTSLNINWTISEATATTDIPNASSVQFGRVVEPDVGTLIRRQLDLGTSTQLSFLELTDEVDSHTVRFEAPFAINNFTGNINGGYLFSRKAREYFGYTANIIAGAASDRVGTSGELFTDTALQDLTNDFTLSMGANFGTESYIAGETKTAGFGGIDVLYDNTWRLSAGVRWENFVRGILPLDLLDFSGDSIISLINELENPNQKLAFEDDDYFPAVGLTYINDGFLNTDNFQIRLGYGKTLVRPDLREFADIQFIDPELNNRVQGNPNLVSSEIEHVDLRTEFLFQSGDSLTFSLFYKDIQNPIESVQRPGPQDATLLSFDNAESGETYGLEVEGLKLLPFGLFLTGNLVVSESELKFAEGSSQTSLSRRLTGHSEYVTNLQLGYDSPNGRHAATLSANVFGERIFFAGLSPTPDAFEQPFNSLDLVYSWYPLDQASVKLRLRNMLGEKRTFEQGGVEIIEVDVGTSVSLDFKWDF